jgi:hypothetical protein
MLIFRYTKPKYENFRGFTRGPTRGVEFREGIKHRIENLNGLKWALMKRYFLDGRAKKEEKKFKKNLKKYLTM